MRFRQRTRKESPQPFPQGMNGMKTRIQNKTGRRRHERILEKRSRRAGAGRHGGFVVAGPDGAGNQDGHLDHIDHNSWRIWAGSCPDALFVFPEAHRDSVLADGVREENCLGLNDGGSCRIGEITVHAVAAAHEFLAPDPETGLYPCLQYIIEGGGFRIYHAGDTLRYEGMLPKLRSFGPIDAALLPVNGRDGARYRRNCIGNMTFQEAADLAGELRPGLVIPGHWDMFADNPGDPAAFADYLNAKYPGEVPCILPGHFTPIRLKARGT